MNVILPGLKTEKLIPPLSGLDFVLSGINELLASGNLNQNFIINSVSDNVKLSINYKK